jgi:hypothetical protein
MTRPVGKGNEGTCTFNECISMGHGSVRITDREREKDRNGKRTSLMDKSRGCSSRRGKGRRYVRKRKRMCYVRMKKKN